MQLRVSQLYKTFTVVAMYILYAMLTCVCFFCHYLVRVIVHTWQLQNAVCFMKRYLSQRKVLGTVSIHLTEIAVESFRFALSLWQPVNGLSVGICCISHSALCCSISFKGM